MLNNDCISLENFSWYGNNRKYIHKNARNGSGGVGFLIHKRILEDFYVSVLNNSYDGILWLEMKHKTDDIYLFPCVCYLPPENSSRYSDVNTFFDTLLQNVYEYQNKGLIFLCGDFNSRCSDNEDFIAGIDGIEHRHVVDFKSNAYGDYLIQFLIDSNMCMLNGRNFIHNDFTSVTVKGCSVVDYCLVSHDALLSFIDFNVTHVSDILNRIGVDSSVASNIPDHSVLSWKIDVQVGLCSHSLPETHSATSYDKFDLNDVRDDFLIGDDIKIRINTIIAELEQGMRAKSDLDIAYNAWCDIIKSEMYSKLKYKTIDPGVNSVKRNKSRKPWWNDNLTELWQTLHEAERKWLKCSNRAQKVELKHRYVYCRKIFDREVQRSKRSYLLKVQNDLLSDLNCDQNQFWKRIGKTGIISDRSKRIPMQVTLNDGSISSDVKIVLQKWQKEFSSLLNVEYNINVDFGNSVDIKNTALDAEISILEIIKAVHKAKVGKAAGIDLIPSEVLKNDTSIFILHSLFNVCFQSGQVPTLWSKSIINPIPKSSSNDPRDPMSYRGISLAATMYKMYTSILNDRIVKWTEDNGLIVDEQNGFRKNRSTVDHLGSLTNLIDTRKKNRKSTFCAFIDFRKAFDSINRNLLWKKLTDIGMSSRMLSAVRSLYHNVTSCVRLNGMFSDWFNVNTGLRQGCSLSTILFNIFINDLATSLKNLNKGVDIGNEKVCILLYADDIVLIAENEAELQILLSQLNDWCKLNGIFVNNNKSNIVHFRPNSIPRSELVFKCGQATIEYTDKYMYLGLMLHEFLDYNVTAKFVAQSAGRALGLLIAKFKNAGGLPYDVYTKLYNSCVIPVISYGAAVWGTKQFSSINAIHHRAMRFFLGTGKYTPNAAVQGEMGWKPVIIEQWKSICNHWNRCLNYNNSRVNKLIFTWAMSKGSIRCKNWPFVVKDKFISLGLHLYTQLPFSQKKLLENITNVLMEMHIEQWNIELQRVAGVSGNGRNKLRTYRTFKNIYHVEKYCKDNLPFPHRSSLAKFRCGVAPIRLETGRYENLQENQRICPLCLDGVESELHVMLKCPIYGVERQLLFDKAISVNNNFNTLDDVEKISFIFSHPDMVRIVAKTCSNILKIRNNTLYSKSLDIT